MIDTQFSAAEHAAMTLAGHRRAALRTVLREYDQERIGLDGLEEVVSLIDTGRWPATQEDVPSRATIFRRLKAWRVELHDHERDQLETNNHRHLFGSVHEDATGTLVWHCRCGEPGPVCTADEADEWDEFERDEAGPPGPMHMASQRSE